MVGCGQESLNISKRNIRDTLGLKSTNWAQMPCEIGLAICSCIPLSSFFFFLHCKDRICYHVHFHVGQRKYQSKRVIDAATEAEL